MDNFQFKLAYQQGRSSIYKNIELNLDNDSDQNTTYLKAIAISTTLPEEEAIRGGFRTTLESAKNISFKIQGTSNGRSISINHSVNNKQYIADTLRNPLISSECFVFLIEPPIQLKYEDDNTAVQQGDFSYPGLQPIQELTITPVVPANPVFTNLYTANINNANEIRKSTEKYDSDREVLYKSGLTKYPAVPFNIDTILNDTAELAEIQDSLYSDTGWSNARYKGTKTGDVGITYDNPAIISSPTSSANYYTTHFRDRSEYTNNYGNIPASMTGQIIQGELFPESTTIGYITGSGRVRVLSDFLFTYLPPATGSLLEPQISASVFKVIEGNRPRRIEENYFYVESLDALYKLDNTGLITSSSKTP